MKNQREFDKLYRECYGELVTSLISYFGLANIELAEDLVQDTFLEAAKRWQNDFPDKPKAWLFKTCKNKLYLN